jgi:RNA polymerase sigma-70 factor (ECF subfamily)
MSTAPQEGAFEWNERQVDADSKPTDAALVARVLKGDQTGFELLVRRHQAAMYRRARWMGLEPDIAGDMVQDAFVKAYENLKDCRDPNRFHVWAGRILRNRCLDFFKSAERRGVPLSPTLPADTGNPETEHEHHSLGEHLRQALAILPQEQREAFLMKHAEELSYEEMAQIAGASISAMKMRVLRARECLRTELGPLLELWNVTR